MIGQILPGFAGIDIGAQHFFVAAAGAPEAFRRFGTFTSGNCAALPGGDPTLISGMGPLSWQKLVGEVGTDLTRWRTDKHFTSWLGLAPGKHQSGKMRRRAPRPKTVAGQIFRDCVLSIAKSKHTALGAFYRRLKGRKGAAVAATAVARKLAELYYRAMTKGMEYVERGITHYEENHRRQTLRYINKMAAALGFTLSPTPAVATT